MIRLSWSNNRAPFKSRYSAFLAFSNPTLLRRTCSTNPNQGGPSSTADQFPDCRRHPAVARDEVYENINVMENDDQVFEQPDSQFVVPPPMPARKRQRVEEKPSTSKNKIQPSAAVVPVKKKRRVRGGAGKVISPEFQRIIDGLIPDARFYVIVKQDILLSATSKKERRKSIACWGQVHKYLPHHRWLVYLRKNPELWKGHVMIVVRKWTPDSELLYGLTPEEMSKLDEFLMEPQRSKFSPYKGGEIAGSGIKSLDDRLRNFAQDEDLQKALLADLDVALESMECVQLDEKCICPKCPETFGQRGDLSQHYGQFHAPEGMQAVQYKCEFVVDEETGQKCGQLFANYNKRQAHIKDEHEKTAKPAKPARVKCPDEGCSQTTTTKVGMKRHMKRKHKDWSLDKIHKTLDMKPRKTRKTGKKVK